MTSTVPQVTGQWGPAEPALQLCSQARVRGDFMTHHRRNCSLGLPWPPPRPLSCPCKSNTPASCSPTGLCSFCVQVKSGLVLGPLARKHLFFNQRVQDPGPTSTWGISKLALGSPALALGVGRRSQCCCGPGRPPSPGRAATPSSPPQPGDDNQPLWKFGSLPIRSPLSSIPVTPPRLMFLSVQKGC